MNYTQNSNIAQVSESTLVIGVDIASENHFARAFDWRGVELTRKVFRFSNTLDGYHLFDEWAVDWQTRSGKADIIVGCEPTGHYWFTFGRYVQEHGMKLVLVNPYHVKQSKELDDNSPRKTDQKDPKTIAMLVKDGRYIIPYMPEGIYAEVRSAVTSRDQIIKELNTASNRIQRWLKIHFPEYLGVYKAFDRVSGLLVLEAAPLPEDIIKLGVEGVNRLWREKKLRGVGKKRAETLVTAAHDSIGLPGGECTRMELRILLEDYKTKQNQLQTVTELLEKTVMQVPNVEKLLAMGVLVHPLCWICVEMFGNLSLFDVIGRIAQRIIGRPAKDTCPGRCCTLFYLEHTCDLLFYDKSRQVWTVRDSGTPKPECQCWRVHKSGQSVAKLRMTVDFTAK